MEISEIVTGEESLTYTEMLVISVELMQDIKKFTGPTQITIALMMVVFLLNKLYPEEKYNKIAREKVAALLMQAPKPRGASDEQAENPPSSGPHH